MFVASTPNYIIVIVYVKLASYTFFRADAEIGEL